MAYNVTLGLFILAGLCGVGIIGALIWVRLIVNDIIDSDHRARD